MRKIDERHVIGAPATPPCSGRRAVVDLQQDHRHVVVLRRVADERRNLAEHPLAQLVGRQVRVLLDQLGQPRLAEAVVARRSSPR